MPGKRTRNMGEIELTFDQANVVTAQKVIERFWFMNPKGWWHGPDGIGSHPILGSDVPYLHYPGIRQAMADSGVDEGFLPDSDWIMAEYVHREQMPRCVPTAINGFIEMFFGAHYSLFGHQLGIYYSPQHYNIVVGGRGSSKTFPMALIMLVWTALHPGEPWLHVGLSLDQAKKAYQVALDIAGRRHYRQDGSLTTHTFSEVFIQGFTQFPQPNIYFKPWDQHDGGEIAGKKLSGNVIMFRPLGDDDLERLRSTEAGNASGDEILREISEEKTIRHIRGCLRGLNPWLMAHLEPQKRSELTQLQQRLGIANVNNDEESVKEIEKRLGDMGVERPKRFFAVGNAGEPEWVWEVMDIADEDPTYAWFIQVTMYDNIKLSPSDRKVLEETWGSDPESRQVELLGRRPIGLGNEIDPDLLRSAVKDDLGGEVIQELAAYGIIHYRKLPSPGHYHVISGDPGKDKIPRRNSWCVLVLDITADPAEVVFFQMGNVKRRAKTYAPYLDAYRYAVRTYPVVAAADVLYDSGGQQSGMHEILLQELQNSQNGHNLVSSQETDILYGNPQDFSNAKKYTASNWLIDVLRKGQLVMPDLRILIRQLSNWTLPDKKIPQDSAMTLFMAIYRCYYFIADRSIGYGTETDAPDSPEGEFAYQPWSLPTFEVEVEGEIGGDFRA